MKHYLIAKKEKCMTNLDQMDHKVLVEVTHMEMVPIHIQLVLTDLVILET